MVDKNKWLSLQPCDVASLRQEIAALRNEINQMKNNNGSGLSGNGWYKLPNGLIIQWGVSDQENINFPTPFPRACFVVTHSKTGISRDTRVNNITRTGFKSQTTGPRGTTYYIALGH